MMAESNLVAHARRELALIDDGSTEQAMINEHMLDMIKVFASFGHSGLSASYTISQLARLLRYEPLAPLTGEPDEWISVGEGVYQNSRCSRIFSETGTPDGRAYDVEGRVFIYPDGSAVNRYPESHVDITFPYLPGAPEAVNVNG